MGSPFFYLLAKKKSDQNGCPWNEMIYECAIPGDCLEILIYAHQNDCPINKINCIVKARKNDNSEIIKWLENNC
jgi:hypothetical protein